MGGVKFVRKFSHLLSVALVALVVGVAFLLTAQTTHAQASAVYKTTHQSPTVLSLNTTTVKFCTFNVKKNQMDCSPISNTRLWLGLGPSGWKGSVYEINGATQRLKAEETWSTLPPNCYQGMMSGASPCRPGGDNAGSYLYGAASEYEMQQITTAAVASQPINLANFYTTVQQSQAFRGPAAVGDKSVAKGFRTVGLYGWSLGNQTNTKNCNTQEAIATGCNGGDGKFENQIAAGMMMPLKWRVKTVTY